MDNTDTQALSFSGNTLSISGNASTVDFAKYLDNTDAQDLKLSDNNLTISNGLTTIDLSKYMDNTDTQALSFSGNTLSISGNASTVDFAKYLDNTDAQDLKLSDNNLTISNGLTTIDLSKYMDNTDTQALSFSGNTLSISGNASTVDFAKYLDNTDAQDLTLTDNSLTITNGTTPVDLSKYMDNTDSQMLSVSGSILSISNGNSIDMSKLKFATDDNQNMESATLNGTVLTIDIENGNPVSVDLAPIVDGYEARIAALEEKMKQVLAKLEVTSVPTEANRPTAVLYQNVPNPTKGYTTIKYYVPESIGNAIIVFYDNNGAKRKEIILYERGEGSVVIPEGEFSSGAYFYTLVTDGLRADTKTMIVSK